MQICPGAHHLPGFLAVEEQRALAAQCRRIGARPAGLYTPVVRHGAKMRLQMACLGLHWNPRSYRYEKLRSDHDGRPVQRIPEALKQLARRAAAEAGMAIRPDICIINAYSPEGRLGLHRDKDEGAAVIEAGIPVVSVSVGDTARFLFGGTRRKDPVKRLLLRSGDVFVFGGPSRLCYHGVAAIVPGTAPAELKMQGRFNLTFRQYSL